MCSWVEILTERNMANSILDLILILEAFPTDLEVSHHRHLCISQTAGTFLTESNREMRMRSQIPGSSFLEALRHIYSLYSQA